jgi:hypothetical protein
VVKDARTELVNLFDKMPPEYRDAVERYYGFGREQQSLAKIQKDNGISEFEARRRVREGERFLYRLGGEKLLPLLELDEAA